MPRSASDISPFNAIAAAFAVSSSLLMPPGIYLLVEHSTRAASMNSQAQLNAEAISTEIIGKASQLWQFQDVRLNEMMSHHVSAQALAVEFRRVFTNDNKTVAAVGNPQPWPVVVRSHPLFDAERQVGRLEIQRSLRPLLINAAWLSLFGLVLAAASFVTLRVVPMRAILKLNDTLRRGTEALTLEVEERRRTEAALQESQQVIGAILNSVPARIFWKDRSLLYLGCNAAFARDAGFSRPEDIVGKDDYQMGWRDQADLYRSRDREVIESARPQLLVDEPQTTPEGNTIRLLTSKTPLRGSNGEITGVLGTYMDVTERVRLEEKLVFSNLLNASAMENAPDGIVVVDENGKIISFNERFVKLWNIPQEFVDRREDGPVLQKVAAQVADQKEFVERVEHLYKHPNETADDELTLKDGRVLERHSAPLHDASRKYLGRIWFFRDVTERRKAERQLSLANAVLKSEIESAPDGVLVVETGSQKASFNRRFAAMWSISPEIEQAGNGDDILSALIAQLKDPAPFRDDVQRFREEPDRPFQRVVELKDGRVFDCHTGTMQQAPGEYLGRISFFRDITETKNAERMIQDELLRTQMQLQVTAQVSQSQALMAGDVGSLAREVTELASHATGCERVNVWLFNEAETELRCVDLYEATPARHSSGMTLNEKDFAHEISVIKTAKYVDADDPLTDPRTAGYVESYLRPLRITSMLDAAIQASGHHFGLLCFEHVDKAHHWTQDEIAFACQLADKIGIAVISQLRRQAEASVRQRDALLHAVSIAATELVTAPSLEEAIPQALKTVGDTIQVDRISVFDCPLAPGEAPLLRFAWSVPGTTALDQRFFENPHLMTPQIVAWHSPLSKGRIITADQRDATDDLKKMLESSGTQSLLVIPISVDGKYWGQMGFEQCKSGRAWPAFEIEILQTLADLMGNAIRRERYVNEIADANRIIQNTPTILYRLRGEPSLSMVYVSQNIKLFGHEPAILTASPTLYQSLIHPDDLAAVQDMVGHALDHNCQRGVSEFRLLTSHGDYRWVENRYTPIRDPAGRLIEVEGLLIDITERKAAEEKISLLARTDPLTGLANRATFIERLQNSFASARRGAPAFAVLYLDLDHFKDINDTLGHPIGDRLLVMAGERLKDNIREADVVARIGGDEFAVLQLDLSDTSDAGALAVKLRAALAEPIQIAGNELRITASIGISPYAAEIAMPEDMLAQADVALYRAKEEGRDQYRFHTEELDIRVRQQVAITDELRMAVDRGEFELFYQPQVELSTNQIVGMEALIRWNHPKRGLLMPPAFIAAAERTGAITAIGQWALDRACQQMNSWRNAGIAPPTIAVNVSPVQIKTSNEFVDFVTDTLTKWHLAPPDLELDVTESLLARATLAQNDVLERLQAIGVKISIDDFGTKYSSLDYLKKYRVSRLKIPQSLVDSATRNPDSAAMVRAIVGIARELKIEVIAQGVETEAQWMFLSATSPVAKVQGFYYSAPVPAGRASELLLDGHIAPASDRSDERKLAALT